MLAGWETCLNPHTRLYCCLISNIANLKYPSTSSCWVYNNSYTLIHMASYISIDLYIYNGQTKAKQWTTPLTSASVVEPLELMSWGTVPIPIKRTILRGKNWRNLQNKLVFICEVGTWTQKTTYFNEHKLETGTGRFYSKFRSMWKVPARTGPTAASLLTSTDFHCDPCLTILPPPSAHWHHLLKVCNECRRTRFQTRYDQQNARYDTILKRYFCNHIRRY